MLFEPGKPPSEFDRKRLQYLTEHFASLQGLGTLVVGLGLALTKMAEVPWKGAGDLLSLFAWAAVIPLVYIYIPRYYRQRFGHVQPQHTIADWSAKSIAIWTVGLVVVVGALSGVGHLLSLSSDTVFSLLMAAILTCIAFRFGFQWPRRGIYMLPIGLAVAYLALYPLWHPLDTRQLELWRILNAGSWGVGMAVVGLLDHIALVRLLPKHVAEDAE